MISKSLHWISENRTWIFSGVGVSIVVGVFYLLRFFSSARPQPSPASVAIANVVSPTPASPSISQTVTLPTVNVTVNPPGQVAASRSDLNPMQHRPRTLPDQPKLSFLRTRTIIVSYEPNRDLVEFFETDDDALNARISYACLACFRNDSSENAENVRAQVKLFGKDGTEIGIGLSRAFWLEHKWDLVDFRVGESQCVILLLANRKTGELTAPGLRRVSDYSGDTLRLDACEINEPLASVEVLLRDSNNRMLITPLKFDFSSDGTKPSLKQAL